MMQRRSFVPVLLGLLILAGLSTARNFYLPLITGTEGLTAQAAAPAEPAPQTADTVSTQPTGTIEQQCQAGQVDVVAESTGDSEHPTVAVSSCFESSTIVPDPLAHDQTPSAVDTGQSTQAQQSETKLTSTVCEKAQPGRCVVETCPPQALDPDNNAQAGGASCTSVASCAPGDTACLNSSIQNASGGASPSLGDVSSLQPSVSGALASAGNENGSNEITNALNPANTSPSPTNPTSAPNAAPSSFDTLAQASAQSMGQTSGTLALNQQVQTDVQTLAPQEEAQTSPVEATPTGNGQTVTTFSPTNEPLALTPSEQADLAEATKPTITGTVTSFFSWVGNTTSAAPTSPFQNGLSSINALAVRG